MRYTQTISWTILRVKRDGASSLINRNTSNGAVTAFLAHARSQIADSHKWFIFMCMLFFRSNISILYLCPRWLKKLKLVLLNPSSDMDYYMCDAYTARVDKIDRFGIRSRIGMFYTRDGEERFSAEGEYRMSSTKITITCDPETHEGVFEIYHLLHADIHFIRIKGMGSIWWAHIQKLTPELQSMIWLSDSVWDGYVVVTSPKSAIAWTFCGSQVIGNTRTFRSHSTTMHPLGNQPSAINTWGCIGVLVASVAIISIGVAVYVYSRK